MFSLAVSDHFMIAHSFKGEIFGPAQKLHGATYVVDVEFRRDALDPEKTVFEEMVAGGGDPASIVEKKGLRQVTDTGAIEAAVDAVIMEFA